jgi:hypothetical protein
MADLALNFLVPNEGDSLLEARPDPLSALARFTGLGLNRIRLPTVKAQDITILWRCQRN